MRSLIALSAALPCLALAGLLAGCAEKDYTPKPRGYPRIDLPARGYAKHSNACPYTFDYPTYGSVVMDSGRNIEPCWQNVKLGPLRGEISLTYKALAKPSDLFQYVNDTYKLTFRHSGKADAIDEIPVNFPEHKVHGVLYNVSGPAASAVQFYATDSVGHFLRGALHFDAAPNVDSIAPVVEFVREDIVQLLRTLEWK